ncbi:MAG: VCBS repeat-containing protein [Planctomycetes bacterium]|nr:VCBS repeat-containing protein [Planctomycetota bacterium]
MNPSIHGWRVALAAFAISGLAAGQQFQEQSGVLMAPSVGPVSYNENALSFDSDNDGDIDLLLPAGDGLASAGAATLPTYIVNTGVVSGNPVFSYESISRLPPNTLICKEAVAIDIELDGDLDLFLPQAFDRPAMLYRNNGAGFFTNVSAARLPGGTFNAFSAAAIDFDNDGDLDLTMAHSGGNTQAGTGGQLQLWQNDGAGFFSDVTAAKLPALGKTSQMNVAVVDIDNDFDLDIILDGPSAPQHLYRNDGKGTFSLSTSLLASNGTTTYESEWADLDGDTDIDGVYVNLAGSSEYTLRNQKAESGSLFFLVSNQTLLGGNGFNDHEVAFMDYDDDGFLDVFVGSVTNTSERVYRNNGNFTFTSQNIFSAQTDTTLDLTIADFDSDGDYDVVTAQGESGSYTDRYYRNSGPADSRVPLWGGSKVTHRNAQAPLVVLSSIVDSTVDDGQQWIDAQIDWTVFPTVGAPVSGSAPLDYSGYPLFRGLIDPGATNDTKALVQFTITATDFAGNQSTSPVQSFTTCGKDLYGVGVGGANVLTLDATGTLSIGSALTIDVSGGNRTPAAS